MAFPLPPLTAMGQGPHPPPPADDPSALVPLTGGRELTVSGLHGGLISHHCLALPQALPRYHLLHHVRQGLLQPVTRHSVISEE